MSWFFTPKRTYNPNMTPVIDAGDLNDIQDAITQLAVLSFDHHARGELTSRDGGHIDVKNVRGIGLLDYGSNRYVGIEVPDPGETLDVTNLVPTAGTFAAATWYYIYLRSNNYVAEYEISATAPFGSVYANMFKPDGMGSYDASYRFIGSFRTDVSSRVIPYSSRDGRFLFTGGDLSDLPAGAAVNTGTYTATPLTFCPPHTRRAVLRCRLFNASATSSEKLHLLPNLGGTLIAPGSSGRILSADNTTGGNTADQRLEVEVAGGSVLAKLDKVDALNSALLSVEGFEDW